MTEKRFIQLDEGYDFIIRDTITHDDLCDAESMVDLLNELHEESIELKHDNKRLVKFIMSKGYTLKDYLEWLQKEVWE